MPDTDKLHQFLGKMVTDMGVAQFNLIIEARP